MVTPNSSMCVKSDAPKRPGGCCCAKNTSRAGPSVARHTFIFLAYLDHCLCPALRPGDVVVLDNLSSHKVKGVRERIETAGAELPYLPPYSPDLNPIEKAWSKLKQLLRSTKARTKEALDKAISELLPEITPENAVAWFRLGLGTSH